MEKYYTDERNIQIVIYLLKINNIKKIIVSPGGTNVSFVASVQHDSFFELYSCVDERSAAYMACGLAEESGEMVALSCTGATASRNYVPALTEAFYRKLPIIAITSSQVESHLGNLFPQAIDRRMRQPDIVNFSVNIPVVKDQDDEWFCEIQMNKAIHYAKKHGGGPVHINLETIYSENYDIKILPSCHVINYVSYEDVLPALPNGRIGIFIGVHSKFTDEEINIIEKFCELYDVCVFGDHTSNYKGNYSIPFSLIGSQKQYRSECRNLDLLIHMGEISGDYFTAFGIIPKTVWRLNEDGEIRDWFHKITYVFEMSEKFFFNKYVNQFSKNHKGTRPLFIDTLKDEYKKIYEQIPDLPFSNIYCAKYLSEKLPNNCVLHLGILNSLRSWNMFKLKNTISCYSNVGGFGIDGGLSSLIGAALVNRGKIYFGVFGDLAFFYDLNSLGNYNISNNIRILLINNGLGVEFKKYDGVGANLGNNTNKYIAAEGHFGSKSPLLVKHYAEDLGFRYLCANDKDTFEKASQEFLSEQFLSKPIIFEVFTNECDEYDAFKIIQNLKRDSKQIIKNNIKKIIGTENISKIRNVIKK